jgi:hypothetical protein
MKPVGGIAAVSGWLKVKNNYSDMLAVIKFKVLKI